MLDDLYGFDWVIPAEGDAGFRWVNLKMVPKGRDQPDGKPELALVGPWGESRLYQPLTASPALFRTFGDLAISEDAIVDFANKYGNLHSDTNGVADEGGDCAPQRKLIAVTLRNWMNEIRRMRIALGLWDLIRNKDERELSRRFEPSGTDIWQYTYPAKPDEDSRTARGKIPPATPIPVPFVSTESASPLTPGRILLRRLVNENLHENSSSLLRFDPKRDVHVVQIAPRHLLAAMWLQFARGIAGDKTYRRCKECGEWFEISGDKEHGAKTTRRLFCSDKCKMRDYRRKQERAVELSSQGKTTKQVADELGSDVKTVKSWLKKKG